VVNSNPRTANELKSLLLVFDLQKKVAISDKQWSVISMAKAERHCYQACAKKRAFQ
jgi:hypothetical protein